MAIRAEEISDILVKEIEGYDPKVKDQPYGTVVQVGDNIATVYGLRDARAGELLAFAGGELGIAMNLEEDTIGAVIMGDDSQIKEGDRVESTGKIAEVPVGEALLGRTIDALGNPIDGLGPIETSEMRTIEFTAPTVPERHSVHEPLQTGIKAVDALIPIGRGQRELIIGDRQTGKTIPTATAFTWLSVKRPTTWQPW